MFQQHVQVHFIQIFQSLYNFPQFNGEKDMGLGINNLQNKLESGGKKEYSDIEIPEDLNEMEYVDDVHMDEDPLDGENENDGQNLVQKEEREDDNDKSTVNNIDTGHKRTQVKH